MDYLIRQGWLVALIAFAFMATVLAMAIWVSPTDQERAVAAARRQRLAEAWARENAPGRVACISESTECRSDADGGVVAFDCHLSWCARR